VVSLRSRVVGHLYDPAERLSAHQRRVTLCAATCNDVHCAHTNVPHSLDVGSSQHGLGGAARIASGLHRNREGVVEVPATLRAIRQTLGGVPQRTLTSPLLRRRQRIPWPGRLGSGSKVFGVAGRHFPRRHD
jgi:hypothetical protein